MPFLPETPSGWLGSSERAAALNLATQRSAAARATGMLGDNLDAETLAAFERTTNQVSRFLNAPVALFSLIEGECQTMLGATGYPGPKIVPSESSMCTHVRDSGRDIIIDDLTRSELGEVAGNMTAAGANAYLGTPVFSPDGQPIGSLCAIDFPSRSWEPSDLDLLRALAEGLTDKIALLASLNRAEASEARLSATLEAIPNIVILFEEHGNVTYVSPQLERDFGIKPEEFMGHGWTKLLHADDMARVGEYRQEIDAESKPYEYEFRLKDREGRWRNLLSKGVPIRLEGGKFAYLSTATEIEGVRRVERELAEERGRLTALLESLPHLVWISDDKGDISYVGPQSFDFLGYAPEELTGQVWAELIHPDDLPDVVNVVASLTTRTTPFEMEYRLRHRDGHYRHALARGARTQDFEGRVQFVCTATSIEEIRKTERELASERRKLAAVVETIPHLVWISSPDGRTLFVGPQIRDILGLEPEAHLGYGWQDLFHPEDAARILGASVEVLGDPAPFEMEYRMRHADGTYRDVIARGTPVTDENGETIYISTATDIAAIRTTERDLANEQTRLAALMEAIPHIVVLTSPETGVNFASPQVRAILGHEPEVLLGFGFYESVIHPEEQEGLLALRERFLGTPEPFEYEFRAQHADGHYVPMLLRGFPLPQGTDLPHSHVVTFTEISAIREAEARAESERRRLETVLDVLPAGVIIVDREGRVTTANVAARIFVAETGRSIADWSAARWIDAEGRETPILLAEAHIPRALAGESVREGRTMRVELAGGARFILCDAEPLRDEAGTITGAVMTIADITELRQAQTAIEDARGEAIRRMERVIDSLPINVALTDPDGRFVYVNESPVRALGLQMEDVIGKFGWESPWIHDGETARITREEYEKGIRGEVARREFSIRLGPDSDDIADIDHSVFPIFDEDGDVEFLLVSAMDVTTQNRATEAIKAEGEQARQIMESTPVMMSLLDPEGRVLYVHEAPLRGSGITRDQIRGQFHWEIFGALTPELRERLREAYDISSRGETALQELAFPLPGGGLIEVQHQMAPILDENGGVRSILSTAIDVSERNRATREIEEERARLRTILNILPAGLLIADAGGNLVDGNAEGQRLFGPSARLRSPEEGEAQEIWPEGWYVEFDGSETPIVLGRGPMYRALQGEEVRETRTIRMKGADGSERFVKCDAQPLRTPEGTVAGAVMTILDITDLREAREEADRARLESIERLQRIIESLPINVVLADKEGRLLYANKLPLEAAGLELSDVTGKIAWESAWMPNEETARITKEEYMKAAAGEIARREFSIRFGEAIVEVDHTVVPIFDARGAVEFLVPSSIDVTDRNRALRQVEEERRRLRQIVETLPIGLFVYDRDRKIVHVNDEALSASGRTLEQLQNGEYPEYSFLEPDGSETPIDLGNTPSQRVLRGESGREPRVLRMHDPGADPAQDRFVRAEAGALVNAEGEIDGAVHTVIDVKPLREAELALAREREAATERLTATLEGVSIFIGLLDLTGRIVWCNRAPLDATGLTFSDVENVRFEDSAWVNHDPEMIRRIGDATRRAAAGEMAFTPIVAKRLGGLMDVDITLAPIRGEDATVRYLVASGIEVTARNMAMRQIEDARMSAERAREIAERATRAKDEFLAVLSHELRTPLTPAMLGLELLSGDLEEILPTLDDPTLATSIAETMGTVRSNLDIQVRLIDDLLDVTRIARGKLELRKTPVDLHDAARHALSIVAPRAVEKRITTVMAADSPQSIVLADPARLRQILWNLLANAVKFTDAGGTVRIETEAVGPEMVRLKVIDTGLGIEPERLGTIFDAFDQGDGAISRGFGGLGLGLAIARSLSRAHGGTLWATSEGRGLGATFVLELPTVEAQQDTNAQERRRAIRQGHAGCRILLIEDNLDTARFTAALLRRAEVEVEVAHSVADAVAMGRGKTWNAILTDIGLPDGDGVDAVQRLRSIGIDAAAVAMSGYGRDEDKARTADAGFRAHLVKPVVFENLLEVLDAILPESCP